VRGDDAKAGWLPLCSDPKVLWWAKLKPRQPIGVVAGTGVRSRGQADGPSGYVHVFR
jgi:hypothetical protein